MTTCQTCTHWNLKGSPAMARLGLAACALGKSWTYLPGHRACQNHAPLAADVLEKRLAWLALPTAKHAKGKAT
jgi:hypothetical protein